MTVQLPGKPSLEVISGDATSMYLPEEPQCYTRKWYFSRQEIEEDSPSRKDGIELKKESQLRKLYCLFLQEIGKSLKVPQVTIAAAMLLCHRFYMRQSHAKNDWQTIATVCMFLACKLEETPRPLKDVVVISFEIMHKRDPSAPKRIRQREVLCKQKELLLIGERLLLATIAFDLNIQLPYMPLVTALKRLNIFSDLAQVAWSFVNDWLCTTLCLQYKPHYIAAGSMFLAAKFQKVKLPTEKEKVWWLEFDVSPKQLQEVIQHMLRLWEQDRNQALPTTLGKVTQSTDGAGKADVTLGKVTQLIDGDGAGTAVVTLGKVTQLTDGAGKAVVTSPQSCVSSASVVDRHSSHKVTGDVGGFGKSIISDRLQNPTSDSQAPVKEVLQTQTSNNGCSSRKSIISDCSQNPSCGESQAPVKQTHTSNNGCSSSVFGNDDMEKIQPITRENIQPITRENIQPITRECNQNPSYNIVSAHKCSKIDADRIREMLKRRRSDKAANKNLEGVGAINAEIDYDAWIERELENGIELESAPSKKPKVVL